MRPKQTGNISVMTSSSETRDIILNSIVFSQMSSAKEPAARSSSSCCDGVQVNVHHPESCCTETQMNNPVCLMTELRSIIINNDQYENAATRSAYDPRWWGLLLLWTHKDAWTSGDDGSCGTWSHDMTVMKRRVMTGGVWVSTGNETSFVIIVIISTEWVCSLNTHRQHVLTHTYTHTQPSVNITMYGAVLTERQDVCRQRGATLTHIHTHTDT